MKYISLVTFLYLSIIHPNPAQSIRRLSLQEVVEIALAQAPATHHSANQFETSLWRYKNYRAQLRPQLILQGMLPGFQQSVIPVIQPEGHTEFKKITQNSMYSSLMLSQVIPFSGTQIWTTSNVQRIDDLENKTTQYNAQPFMVGVRQPIFAFNSQKWSKKIEPLYLEEAQKKLNENTQLIMWQSAWYFFGYLKIQTQYELAVSIHNDSESNLNIANVQIERGLISTNNYARVKLNLLTAQKTMNEAELNLKNAALLLKSYIGYRKNQELSLETPAKIPFFSIDAPLALAEALNNRKDPVAYKRRMEEMNREIDQATKSNGVNTYLDGQYGLIKSSANYQNLFNETEKHNAISVSLRIPILDWGRSSSKVKKAQADKKLLEYELQQTKTDFKREISMEIERFPLLYKQLDIGKEAEMVAKNAYAVALQEFKNGDLSITELNIAQENRKNTRQSFIRTIEDFWLAYYRIRYLTLYDFEQKQRIH